MSSLAAWSQRAIQRDLTPIRTPLNPCSSLALTPLKDDSSWVPVNGDGEVSRPPEEGRRGVGIGSRSVGSREEWGLDRALGVTRKVSSYLRLMDRSGQVRLLL